MFGSWTGFVLLCVVGWAGDFEVRTWTDIRGKQLTGKFVEQVGDQVTIESDGRKFTIPFARFSEADQEYLKSVDQFPAVEKAPAEEPAKPAEPTVKKNSPATERIWTDNANKKINARFVRMHNGNVVLQNQNVFTVPFFNLSVEDQDYVREFLTARGQADLVPAQPAPREEVRPGNNPGNVPPVVPPPSNDLAAKIRADIARQQAEAAARQEEFRQRNEQRRKEAEERHKEMLERMAQQRSSSFPSPSPPVAPPSNDDFQKQMEKSRKEAEERFKAHQQRMEQERLAQANRPPQTPRPTPTNPAPPPRPVSPPTGPVATSTFPTRQPLMQDVYECEKCHKSITAEQAKSNLTCPHCGVFWASKPNEVRSSAAIGAAGLIGFIVGLFVIALVVVGVIAVPVVIIVVIVRVCSKPVAPPSESPFGAPKNPWG